MEIKEADEEMQHPWLLIPNERKQFFYNVLDNQFHATSMPELYNKFVLTSSFGWLVLMDFDTDDCCLWNPVSLEKIELPELDYSRAFTRCVLSKPPTEPNCHILITSLIIKVHAFCKVGDDEFVVETTCNNEEVFLFAVEAYRGKIYGIMCPDYRFVTVDFMDKTLELNPILMEAGHPWKMLFPTRSWSPLVANYLIESSCGELLLVHKMLTSHHLGESMDFRVFRVDVDRMECVELEDIGNRTIFLNNCGGVFCCSSAGFKSNSIYYTIPTSRNLYIYDLDDRSTTRSLPCPIIKRSESILKSQNYWVPPQTFPNLLR